MNKLRSGYVYTHKKINVKIKGWVATKLTPMLTLILCLTIQPGFSRDAQDEMKDVAVKETRQGISVTGTVTDEAGDPMPGVNVLVKETSTGIVSNIDGNYSINVPGEDAVLVFSFVGYTTEEITVGERRIIDVSLREDTRFIEEVVVVGYGTQRKVTMTGAVAAVKVDEALANRTVPNVSTGLQGLLPGLAVAQNTGMAGNNDVSLMIRGMGTVNNADPLIVVDGMPDVDINRININDIENISVLKDAAASSVYGSRAANGVILITTRTGKEAEKTTVNFSGSYTWGVPTNRYHFMNDYPRGLELHRATFAVNNDEAAQGFRKGTIDQWMALGMIDPLRYPNTDWWDIIIRTETVQNYNLSASGSSDRANFFASIGVMDQNGLQINNDFVRYNARFNFDYKVRNNMNVGFRFSGNWSKQNYSRPDGFTQDDASFFDIFAAIPGITPYDPVTGYYGGVMAYYAGAQAYNPLVDFTNVLRNKRNRQEVMPSVYIDWTPVKGLTARLDYTINYYNQFSSNAPIPAEGYNFQTERFMGRVYVGPNAGISNTTNTGYKTNLSARLNYQITLATHHNISAMALYGEEYWYSRSQSASRNDRIHYSLEEINAALTTVQSNGGSSEAEGLRSVVGRINYSAYDKYLFEFNIRADASSRLYEGNQWGYFPSAALGWRFSEENFMKSFSSGWLSQGKLRVSYGSLGNVSGVTRYEQNEVLSSSNYWINNAAVTGFVNRKMINQDLKWEKTTVFNLGLDMGFLKNRLTAELDYYDKLTTGMIRPSDMSRMLTGAYDAPRQNIGVMRVRGMEANITWREKKADFDYMVNFNVSYLRPRLEKWNEYLPKGYRYVDMPYEFTYTYLDTGLAQTWQDVYNALMQGQPGDVQRRDMNGDGIISSEDMVAYPDYLRRNPTANFGLNANVSWKGIDLSVLVTAATGRKDFWSNRYNTLSPSATHYAWNWDHWFNTWSWENRDSSWPRLAGANGGESTYLLDNLAYLRLKNLQLGYSLPKRWINVLFIDNFRIYASAENIATLTSFRGVDPERSGSVDANNVFPLIKSFTVGINVRF